jgi:uncharacterized DUF497 family protein
MSVIESTPDILNGTPVFKGTRVPIRNLFDCLIAGETIQDFLEDFPTVSFEQASYVFSDIYALSRFDDEHSEDEERWVLLGKSLSETILVVVHTFRDKNGVEFTRIISARKATKNEQKAYNKRCPK